MILNQIWIHFLRPWPKITNVFIVSIVWIQKIRLAMNLFFIPLSMIQHQSEVK